MKTALLTLLFSLTTSQFVEVAAQGRQLARNHRRGSPASSATLSPGRLLPAAKHSQTGRRSSDANQWSSVLPIRRVILYSNGVAYIERRGLIRNHAEVSLSFKQSQVDDVLKSMVVIDLGKGRVGAVSYNSSEPASARMNEIPFAISAATDGSSGGGLAGVLSKLQGARVIVTTATRTVTGSVLTVEAQRSQTEINKPATVTHRLVLASDGGALAAFELSEVRSVQLADEGSRRDLSEFAHAAASARRRDAKTIVVTSDGAGERELVVSYTIAAPIWKTTYRVVLDTTGKPFFQGWAIVDNVSEEDWNGIELSLVSGTPVSFIQPIQNPVYRYRPVVPLQDDLNLKPQMYEPAEEGSGETGELHGKITDPNGAVVPGARLTLTNVATQQTLGLTVDSNGVYHSGILPAGKFTLKVSAPGFKDLVTDLRVQPSEHSRYDLRLEVGGVSESVTVVDSSSVEVTSSAIQQLPTQGADSLAFSVSVNGARNNSRRKSIGDLLSHHESGVQANTSANGIGDLFEYHIDQPVTVLRDRSALIPILQTRMEGERVSIYRGRADDDDENESPSRPLGGMLLKNTSPLTLEDGSLTVLDGDAYAGEALLERLKPNEERLVSFALDLGTLVNAHDDGEDRQPTFLVRAVNGVIEAHYYSTRQKVYTLVNQTDKPRIVYIEHPRDESNNWELAAAGNQPVNLKDDNKTSPEANDTGTTPDNHAFVTTTKNYYRFRVSLQPHQKVEFPVVERSEYRDTYQLTNFTRKDLEFFIARKYIDDKSRAALEELIALKDKVANAETRLHEIDKEAEEIGKDQERLRENIKALTDTAEAKQLVVRYVAKADQQEGRLDQLEKERRAVTEEKARRQLELGAAIRAISLDRRLN